MFNERMAIIPLDEYNKLLAKKDVFDIVYDVIRLPQVKTQEDVCRILAERSITIGGNGILIKVHFVAEAVVSPVYEAPSTDPLKPEQEEDSRIQKIKKFFRGASKG